MKKIKIFKSMPVIAVLMLLIASAIAFPVLAERFQVKGMENGARNLEISSLKMPDLVVEKKQDEIKVKDIITMTEEEEKVFDEIVLLLQKSTLLISPKSRELSETESNKMIELRKKFRTGSIMSQKPLPIGENLEKPYFNPENETYYYPEAEMTDEELLQIIDFDAKLDKAFAKFYEAYIQNEMENTDIKITEEEAIKSAKNTIERIFDVDLDNMDINCHFSIDEYRNERFWRIIFQPKNIDILIEQEKLYWMYFSKVNIYTGKVEYVDTFYSGQVEEVGNSPVTDLKNIDDHKEIAEEFLKNKLNGKNIEFLKAYIPKHSNAPLLSRKVYLVYKAEDKYIEFEFIYGSKRMMALFFHDNPIRLNEKINGMEQEPIGSIN
ncbi:hypothetical protein [Tissierella praeacuta]|uniref:hypothetical protein n=1 Tax=Tissierella praeacuta TaxID=43131 RepID=UPI003342DEB0